MKNPYSLILVAAILASTAKVVAEDICSTLGGTIIEDVTLNVPSDYATIQAALACVSDKQIATDVTVTIQVANGTYTDYGSIVVDHPQGDQLEIIGNTTTPSSVTIKFASGKNAVRVSDGRTLGLINGFVLDGVNKTGNGLYADFDSTIRTGSALTVKNFVSGVRADYNSNIKCNGITSEYNTTGFVSNLSSAIFCDDSEAKNNSSFGYQAHLKGIIDARNSTASNNGQGVRAQEGSMINIESGTVQNNTTFGVVATNASYIQALSATSSSNGTNYSPAINTVGNANSYVNQ